MPGLDAFNNLNDNALKIHPDTPSEDRYAHTWKTNACIMNTAPLSVQFTFPNLDNPVLGNTVEGPLTTAPIAANAERAYDFARNNPSFTFASMYNRMVDDPEGFAKYVAYQKTIPDKDYKRVFNKDYRGTIGPLRFTSDTANEDPNAVIVSEAPPEGFDVRNPNGVYHPEDSRFGSRPSVSVWGGPAYVESIDDISHRKPLQVFNDRGREMSFNFTNLKPTSSRLNIPDLKYMRRPSATFWHELMHAFQLSGLRGAQELNPEFDEDVDRGVLSNNYSFSPIEQVQAVANLNASYQALLNAMRKNPDQFPEEVWELFGKYPAYGTRDSFMERNEMLMANPHLAFKYLGPDASRALIGMQEIKDRLREVILTPKDERPEWMTPYYIRELYKARNRYSDSYFVQNATQNQSRYGRV